MSLQSEVLNMETVRRVGVYAFFLSTLISLPSSRALAQADFYKGKTIKIIRGGGPGGSGGGRCEGEM